MSSLHTWTYNRAPDQPRLPADLTNVNHLHWLSNNTRYIDPTHHEECLDVDQLTFHRRVRRKEEAEGLFMADENRV
jgi:hypothetical protein